MRIGHAPLAGLAAAGAALLAGADTPHSAARSPRDGTCVTCHAGIEEIHPGFPLSCVDCHGGDDTAKRKEDAHVLPRVPPPGDERVRGRFEDLPYQRFKNPSNLRVARDVCGTCHEDVCANVEKSLHATTTGHLGDGFYEHGLVGTKRPFYSIFPVRDEDGHVPPKALRATEQVPGFAKGAPKDRIATHYTDLPRKACMQCHLYSEGRAVDGRVGLDGDYRGEGCAACHVTYADDGRSRSADRTIPKLEPGHPVAHRFTTRIPTATCTRCHYGDASIGLHFRGLAQLVPGMPAGPEVPTTTDKPLNGVFYIRDPDMTPPDIHHQRGMHCIDCHTAADTMGDGNLWPQMDHAVEIECTSCHGTFERVTDMMTSHGRRVPNLERRGDRFFLRSKVTGKVHEVVQVKHVIDPDRPEYSPRAAAAMTGDHARLECYACHAGWNVDFFGFHFDRNEQFTQLDLLSGERTPGRVTTQEKVFATFNQLRLGFNHEGKIAPYMVGFSTIGSAHDRNGETILRQATPETRAGLSGITMVPHQTHSVRPEARTCVECHRSPATWGLGSPNFRLTREFGFAVNARGLHAVALDLADPRRAGPVATLPIPGRARTVALRTDEVHARATHAYVGGEDGYLTVVSLANPVLPRVVWRKKRLEDPRRMLVQGRHLWVADGVGGLRIFDLSRPTAPEQIGWMPSLDARALAVAFPWVILADGVGGVVIVDVSDPRAPRALSAVDLNGENSAPNEALDVAVFFQYSRTRQGRPGRLTRSRARHLAFVAAGLDGVRVVDFTAPARPRLISPRSLRFPRGDITGVAVNTVFDVGSAGGGIPSRERDYLYVRAEVGPDGNRQQRVVAFDVSDPLRPRAVPRANLRVYGGNGRLLMLRAYNAPFLQHFVLAAGAGGVGSLVDVSKLSASGARLAAVWPGIEGLRDLAVEELALDRLQTEEGRWIKDISHEGCRYLTPQEILKVLRAPIAVSAEARGRYGDLVDPRSRRTRRTR